MRFKQIVENLTTAGSVATVAQPMMTQTRENTNVKGLKPVQQVIKGKAIKKGPYANSIVESKVTEDDLAEQDLIVIPGQGRLKRTGFVKHDLDQDEHEGHTLKNSLHTIARAASDLDKRLSVQSEFPEWVSEKIGAAKGMMVSVMDYLISSQEMQHDPDAINELSSALLQRAAQAATDKRNQAMEPKLHNALGGGYMNPLATHYDDVSQKISNRAAKVGKKETIQKIASKIASPAVMRKIGMNEGSQRVDSLVTDALRVMKGPEVSDAVLALKRVLGDRAYNERRSWYSFYVDQIHDMYGQQSINEGDVSTGNLQTMYNLARMAKNYCSDPEGKEALTELLRILKWYMDQAEQGVAEGILGSDPNRGQKVPHWAKRGIVGKIGRKLDPAWSDVQMTVPQHLLSKQSSVPATNSPATKDMPKATSITPTRAIPQRAGTNSSHQVPKNVVKTIADKPGVEEGDMFGDAEVSWEKGGRRAPTGAFRNPNFGNVLQKSVNKHNKAIVKTRQDIGSRVADIGAGGKEHNVKTDAAWDAAKKKVSEGYKKK